MKNLQILLLCVFIVSAEVAIRFDGTEIIGNGYWISGPKPSFLNNTKSRYDMAGIRFNTPDVWWPGFTGETNFIADSLGDIEGDGTVWQEILFTELAREDSRIIYPGGDELQDKNMAFNGKAVDNGLNGTPQEAYLLFKTGSKGVVPYDAKQPEPVTLADLSTVTSGSDYYNADYRYLDTSGVKIGRYSGSMFDNFMGETQVILPLESDSITVNNVKGVISPKYTTPIYWISMIAAQEYFNIDYQFLSGIFAKETNVGTESFHFGAGLGNGKFDNSEKTFGCGEVEKNTFASVGLAQPHLFPEHEAILSGARSVNEMGSKFNFTDVMFGEEYMGQGQFTLESPYVVTSIFASAHVFFWLWDYMVYSERVCLKEVLDQHEDPYFVPALLSLLYNRGLSYDRDSVMWKQYYSEYLDMDAVEKLNTGHENYREEILIGLFAMESASKKAFTDLSIPLYDTTLTLELLRTFFYGGGGSVASQGDGGLLKHFSVDRAAFDADLENAFEALAAHWGEKATPTISFRYDLITLLRVLKPHFSYERVRPLDSESQAFIIARNIETDSCGCDGEVIDRSFPYGEIVGAKKAGEEFLLQVTVSDDNGVASVEWANKADWKKWYPAKKGATDYICKVPLKDIEGVDSLWVMVTDKSGNSIVRTVALEEFGDVGIKENSQSLKKAMLTTTNGKRVHFSHSDHSAKQMSASLYDVQGRRIATLYDGAATPQKELHLQGFASGFYLLLITVDGTTYKTKLSL